VNITESIKTQMASRRFYSHNAFWIVLKPTVKFCNDGEIELNDEA
jgi:hypothetical protein